MKFRTLLIASLLTLTVSVQAQNLEYYKEIVKELSSEAYQGRGYARDGVIKAGKYIEKEFVKAGALEVSTQSFAIDVNTFPGKMEVSVDGRRLQPGRDFVMREYSPGAKGEYKLYYLDTLNYDSAKLFADLAKPENKDVLVVCDFWFTYKHKEDFKRLQTNGGSQNAGLIYVWNTPLKFYKAYADHVVDKPIVWVSPEFPKDAKTVALDVENKFITGYVSDNVIAKIEGRRHDGCFVFTAHYDHLGNLGSNLYFPGANDNASGTATIITLAQYYSKHRPAYDVYFIAFTGEDTGLNGSNYFVEHPLFPLESIKYLFNLDMVGDNNPVQYCEISEQGKAGFELMEAINARKHYYEKLNLGKLAANSDHYPFAMKGVPCIMFENENGDAFANYHTAQDNWENAVFDTYQPVFKLVTDCVKKMKQ